jgi:TRAP-type C4-dicarboxylate transport system substrate-binding protein
MMKKGFCVLFVILIAFVLIPGVMAADLKKIPLTWSDHAPPSAGGNVFMKTEWVPRVNAQISKIGYELDITYYHAQSLYKYVDQVQALEDGLIDITTTVLSWESARTPLHLVLTFPLMGFKDSVAASHMWFKLNETIPEFSAEFAKYKDLFHWLPLPANLNGNKIYRVPSDLKGVRIQSTGIMGNIYRSVGASPLRQPPSDWYTSLDRGLIDAINIGIYGAVMFKLQEVVNTHIFPYEDNFGRPAMAVIMNSKKYESLPPGVRQAINDNVEWASDKMSVIDDENTTEAFELVKKLGHTIVTLTPDEMKLWNTAAEPLHEEWIEEMEAKGLPGRKVYEEAKRINREFSK